MYCIKSDNELRMSACNIALLCMHGSPSFRVVRKRYVDSSNICWNCHVVKRNAAWIDWLWRDILRPRRSSLFFWSHESAFFFITELVFSVPHLILSSLTFCSSVGDFMLHWMLVLVSYVADHLHSIPTDHKCDDLSNWDLQDLNSWVLGHCST